MHACVCVCERERDRERERERERERGGGKGRESNGVRVYGVVVAPKLTCLYHASTTSTFGESVSGIIRKQLSVVNVQKWSKHWVIPDQG